MEEGESSECMHNILLLLVSLRPDEERRSLFGIMNTRADRPERMILIFDGVYVVYIDDIDF